MNAYIELKNVTKQIKKFPVLENVNLTLSKGKIYGFQGINGSGKTMLLRAILGLIKVDGEVAVAGKSVKTHLPYPQKAGILIENPSLVNEFSGLKNLEILAKVHKEVITKQDMEKLLALVGLKPNDRRPVRKYSLGMRQKLGLAQAFLGDNDLLVLDEPTNALDEESIQHIWQILQEYRSKGKTILLTCHDSNLLFEICDDVFKMREGQLL